MQRELHDVRALLTLVAQALKVELPEPPAEPSLSDLSYSHSRVAPASPLPPLPPTHAGSSRASVYIPLAEESAERHAGRGAGPPKPSDGSFGGTPSQPQRQKW